MKVEIYWNSKVKAFSVRALDGRKKGKVVGHAKKLLIRDALFVVREAGRQLVLSSGYKTVHAFVRGELSAVVWEDPCMINDWTRGDEAYGKVARCRLGQDVRYNPRKDASFVDIDYQGNPIAVRSESPMVYLRTFDKTPAILAFDPCKMTAAESAAATV